MNRVHDVDLWSKLLGLERPWTVGRIDLNVKGQKVEVFLEHEEGTLWACPECGKRFPAYDHKEERVWRHLDTMAFQTWVHARPPRVECPHHGVRQVEVPWAEPGSHFTRFFERFSIDVSQETDTQGASRILKLSWDETWGLQERAVARGLLRRGPLVLRSMGVDEKAVGHGQTYMTLVYDLADPKVVWIGEDRKKETLDGFFQGLSLAQRTAIEEVGLDMWDPFISSIQDYVPGATGKMVFDRFHIMKHANEGVDKVRRTENRSLLLEGDPTLKGSKYLWLHRRATLPGKDVPRFQELQALHLHTGRAYALKEALSDLWEYRSDGWARKFWKQWYFWATHSRLTPMIKVARMIKDHLSGVMSYFTHRITNAVAEGLNSKITTIQKMAYGFRNKEHFKTAVLFRCGGLDLYPGVSSSTHPKAG